MANIDAGVFQMIHEHYHKVKSLEKNDKTCTETDHDWGQNEAKILLDTMIYNIENLISNIGKDHKCFYRLMSMKCALMYEEAKYFVNIQNEEQAQEKMAKTLEIVKDHFAKPELTFLILRIINHYSFLLLKHGDYQKPHIMLEDASKLYNELTSKNSSPTLYTADEIFSPHSTIATKEDTIEKVERLMINNLLMLCFVHNKKGNHDKYAYYNHQILKMQLKTKEYEASSWAIKAVKIASYLISKHRFREARHHLAAAFHILQESETELKNSEPTEANIKKWEELQIRFGDVAKCWVKYGLFLFNLSKSRLVSTFYGEHSQFSENLLLPPFEINIPPCAHTKIQAAMQETAKQTYPEIVIPSKEKGEEYDNDIVYQCKKSFGSKVTKEYDGNLVEKLQVVTSPVTSDQINNFERGDNDDNADKTEAEEIENKNINEEESIEMSEKGNGITKNAIEKDEVTEIKGSKMEELNSVYTANEMNSGKITNDIFSDITEKDSMNLHNTQENRNQTEIMDEKGSGIIQNATVSEEGTEIKDFNTRELFINSYIANEVNSSDNIATNVISGMTMEDSMNVLYTQETKYQTDSTEVIIPPINPKTESTQKDALHILFAGLATEESGYIQGSQDASEAISKMRAADKVPETEEDLLLFPSLDLSDLENQVTVDLIEDADQARTLFLFTHSWLKRFKMCYTLKDNPLEYADAILDLCELYRYLAFYEEDTGCQYLVQKKRADALETLIAVLREVRPRCSMAVSIELLRELSEVQLELMGLNLRSLPKTQESTMPPCNTHAPDYTSPKMEAMSDVHSRLEQFDYSLGHRADQSDGLSEFSI